MNDIVYWDTVLDRCDFRRREPPSHSDWSGRDPKREDMLSRVVLRFSTCSKSSLLNTVVPSSSLLEMPPEHQNLSLTSPGLSCSSMAAPPDMAELKSTEG